jgi:Tannase and feruloyl esterase
MKRPVYLVPAILTAAAALLAVPVEGATCADLTTLALPNVTIDSAKLVAPGAFTPPPAPRVAAAPEVGGVAPNGRGTAAGRGAGGQGAAGRGAGAAAAESYKKLPSFCRVQATSRPSSDSDIKIEVWLPESGWNGKFQGVGNGGWAGTIGYPALATALAAGYATASTDTGHVGNTAAFALGHPEKLVDMGYRAIHEMTVQGKAITDAFYGSGPKLAFFNGCSLGGRQAITEAERYPADYNGIVAGASAIYNMQIHVARIALNAIAHRTPDSYVPPEKYAAVHTAVLDACDALDGVKDGVLEDPLRCHFDPKVLECKGADSPSCLTPPQVETMRLLYSPVKMGKAGALSPLLQPGTELGWAILAGPAPVGTALEPMRYIVFKDPQWDMKKFNAATDFDLALKADSENILSLTDPNLKPYFDRGGKLLMYHGWQDPQVPAQNSVKFFGDVLKTTGLSHAGSSIQLYMVPGMNHCQGGPGTDTFDKMGAIESFVATGKAPATIVASHLAAGKVDRTRPLCPFGHVAKWKGTGSTDDAANFACVAESADTRSR